MVNKIKDELYERKLYQAHVKIYNNPSLMAMCYVTETRRKSREDIMDEIQENVQSVDSMSYCHRITKEGTPYIELTIIPKDLMRAVMSPGTYMEDYYKNLYGNKENT